MKDWSRNDKLAFASVVIGVLGIGMAVVQPLIGNGSDSTIRRVPIPPQTPIIVKKEPETNKEIDINISGHSNVVTILPQQNDKFKSIDANITGHNGDQTVYLGSSQSANVNVTGANNTVCVAKSLAGQITYNAVGENNSEKMIDTPQTK